jgi:hypothetical protein
MMMIAPPVRIISPRRSGKLSNIIVAQKPNSTHSMAFGMRIEERLVVNALPPRRRIKLSGPLDAVKIDDCATMP